MLQIAICDDEVTNILKVKELAELFFRTHCVEIRIETYKSSDNLLYDMQDGQYFDLFLLDIEMPEISGMDLAKTIYRNIPSARIIFITSHLEYAIEAYEFSVFRYIPKKLLDDKLLIALEDFYKLYCLERDEYYVIQVKNRIEKVAYREILYILKNGKYAVFHLKNGEMKSIRKTLAQFFEELNKEYFYFADRGCIVNLANVVGLNENGVIFGHNEHIQISKANISEFKSIMLRFWGKQI